MAWSFSSLSTYEDCPRKYKFKYIDRLPEPPSPAAERGTQMHAHLEDYVLKNEPVPENLEYMLPELDDWKTIGCQIEEPWGFDKDWQPTDWKDAWLRMKLDLMIPSTGLVVDYKTGKKDGNEAKHARQGLLYAIGTHIRYPELKSVTVKFEYLDHKTDSLKVWRPEQLTVGKRVFNNQVEQMESDRLFAPKPNKWKCRFCPFTCDHRVEI